MFNWKGVSSPESGIEREPEVSVSIRWIVLVAILASISAPVSPAEAYTVQDLVGLAGPHECFQVKFRWTPPNPGPPTGITRHTIFRDGIQVWSVPGFVTSGVDDTWLVRNQAHEYSVAIVDGEGFEHPQSAPILLGESPCPAPDLILETRVMLFNFRDFEPQEPVTVEAENDSWFGPGGTSSWLSAASYGLQTLSGNVTGWFEMPLGVSDYCATLNAGSGLWSDCDWPLIYSHAYQVASPFVSLAGVERAVMVFNGTGKQSTAGTAFGGIDSIVLKTGGGPKTRVHELGHELNGTAHARSIECAASGSATSGWFPPDVFDLGSGGCSVGLGDPWDPMSPAGGSVGGHTFHYSAFHKHRMGYLGDQQIETWAPGDPDWIFVLEALETNAGGTKMVKIPVGNESYYFLEYRSDPQFEGVLVRLKVGFQHDADTFIPHAADGSWLYLRDEGGHNEFRGPCFNVFGVHSNGSSAAFGVRSTCAPGGCGLVGIEPCLVIVGLSMARRRRARPQTRI